MQQESGVAWRDVVKSVGFGLMLSIPLLGPIGHWIVFPCLSPATIFVAVPWLDFVVGEDLTNRGPTSSRWDRYHYALPHAYVVLWLLCLAWTGYELDMPNLASVDRAGLLVAAGIASAFATCAAHELVHRGRHSDQWAARIAMAMVCYGHFVVEHLHHHATAGRVEQGTVPRPGETMYGFIVRNACFSFGNAYGVAEAIRVRRGCRGGGIAWFVSMC